ncbi:MAG: hydantoinase/oxoprolinase family protein [Vulcanimicrobiaceae bacterium]
MRKLRLGIDVGGTFTDVVAVDASTRELVASVKVPTTHGASEGVAAGIVAGIERILRDANVAAADVAFIAHSTTQATNALLEGDVASVGILGLYQPLNAWIAIRQMRFGAMELAPGIAFAPSFAFARSDDALAMREAVDALLAGGAQTVAVSEPFGVDAAQGEEIAASYARTRGAPATSGHDVSSTYGLRARTRTAAINAAILPKMLRTARMTREAVESAAIAAPLMVMRSDGGVMDVREIERRPILTLLSGPAAGVAGALLHEQVSDGIFIEVGGTSSDCSAIRAGQPQMHPARIGGHRTMLQTLDVRTLAIAGGSMTRAGAGGIVDAGPRSAHIAGCAYACFTDPGALEGARLELTSPQRGDPRDYAVIVTRAGARVALTVTCAANAVGEVPPGAFSQGNAESARAGFALLAAHLGKDAASVDGLARRVLDMASAKMTACIRELAADYALDPAQIVLVGGGGAAGALVPHAAKAMGLPFRIARDAEVISPVGVALALVRDAVERTIVDPGPEDIARIRAEATDRVIAAGAAPDRVEVAIEIDAQRNRVRAVASGATALAESAARAACGEPEQRAAAARSLGVEPEQTERIDLTPSLSAYRSTRRVPGRFGRTHAVEDVRIVDERGVVRAGMRSPKIERTQAANLESVLGRALEDATSFGDVGRALPEVYLVHGARISEFAGLASASQAVSLVKEELAGRDPGEFVAIVLVRRAA